MCTVLLSDTGRIAGEQIDIASLLSAIWNRNLASKLDAVPQDVEVCASHSTSDRKEPVPDNLDAYRESSVSQALRLLLTALDS